MLNGDEILEMINATDKERAIIRECKRRIIRQTRWEEEKRKDPSIPRQRRFDGPTAADLLEEHKDLEPPRFVALMEALKAKLEEDGNGAAAP